MPVEDGVLSQLLFVEPNGGSGGEPRKVAEPFHEDADDPARGRVRSVSAKEPAEARSSFIGSKSVTPVGGGRQGNHAVRQVREVPQPRAWRGEVPVDDPNDLVTFEDE